MKSRFSLGKGYQQSKPVSWIVAVKNQGGKIGLLNFLNMRSLKGQLGKYYIDLIPVERHLQLPEKNIRILPSKKDQVNRARQGSGG